MEKGNIKMNIVNPNVAGIDIGSRSHFVAVGQADNEIEEFGVYAEGLTAICNYLQKFGVTTVALESTGDYWQNLFTELIKFDFEIILVNGKFTKNAKGKKTDVKDARWIQQLLKRLETLPTMNNFSPGNNELIFPNSGTIVYFYTKPLPTRNFISNGESLKIHSYIPLM